MQRQGNGLDGFGGPDGLRRVIDRSIETALADNRLAARFAGTDIPRLKHWLAGHFGESLGGTNQAATAPEIDPDRPELNALAENFQRAMTEFGVPYSQHARLVALLAPLHRDLTGK